MGLTEGHWFEYEDELNERQLKRALEDEQRAYDRGYKRGQEDLKKQIEQQETTKKNQNDQLDYKKAFELLMCAMVMKTLAPSMKSSYGSPDLCIQCMEKGRNFAYGDDGEKRLVCDRCPYNITAYKGCDNP